MGRFIDVILRDQFGVTGYGGSTLDTELPIGVLISSITMELNGLGHANQTLATMLAAFDTIKVVGSGKHTYKHMSGEHAFYKFISRAGFLPHYKTSTTTSVQTDVHVPVLFGRFPTDLDYALDTRQWQSKSSITLKISFDSTNLGYFTTDSYMTITAKVYRPSNGENIQPKGCFKEYQVYSESAGTSTIEKELTVGELYESLLLYMSVVGGNEHSDIILDGNVRNVTLRDMTPNTLLHELKQYCDDAAYAVMVAANDITTAYLPISLPALVDTKGYSDITFRHTRAASTTSVLYACTVVDLPAGVAPRGPESSKPLPASPEESGGVVVEPFSRTKLGIGRNFAPLIK